MKQAFALIAFVLGISSFAHANEPATFVTKSVDFSYSSFRSYYACSYAETQAVNYLKQLGARNIRVSCSGGLPHMDAIFLRATFRAAVQGGQSTATWQAVKIRNRDACDFNERLVRELLPEFSIRNVYKSGTCWDSQGRFTYNLSVLK